MADSNSIQLTYAKNSGAYGALPSSGAKVIRVARESLAQETESTASQEIRSDLQIPDIIRTGIRASGEIGAEFSYAAFDDFIQWSQRASGSAWAATVTHSAVNIAATAASSRFTRASGDFVADGFLVGKWIKTAGFTNAANNSRWKISAVAATTIDVVQTGLIVDEASASGRTITQLAYVENGTTPTEFAIERQYTDLSNIFEQFVGCQLDGLNLSIGTGGIIQAAFPIVGQKGLDAVSTMDAPDAAPANDVMNSIDHVQAFYEGGYLAANVLGIIDWSVQTRLGVRARAEVGSLGPIGLGKGTYAVTGTLRAYFTTTAQLVKYRAWTKTKLALILKDSNSNRYFVEWPAVRLSAGKVVASGQNQDIIADFTWTAYRDSTEGITCRWSRDP